MTDWYGYRVRGSESALYIGPLPGRKRIAIYEVNGSILTPLGYFRDEEKARRCLELLSFFIETGRPRVD